MKRPTAASLKKVTVDNLEVLGPERLASILFDVAQGRPDLKRRLRMTEEAPAAWDADLFVELHVQLSRLAETYCRASGPDCGGCSVRGDCASAAESRVVRPRHAPANDTGALPDRLADCLAESDLRATQRLEQHLP